MDINFHYYTIKTLATYAGFNAEDAQKIAYYSQQVDDFIMHSPFIIQVEPPDFFIKNGLAQKLSTNQWVFAPCTTGVSLLRSFSSAFQQSTLMPFHFITPERATKRERSHVKNKKNINRADLRCIAANRKPSLLINALFETINPDDVMALGMWLHTFADTYAHEGFSGFHGWENASYVQEGLSVAESALFRAMPSIGHANAGSVPDTCGAAFNVYAKQSEHAAFESLIKRDNTIFFADCARRILDILCAINKKTPYSDVAWQTLRINLEMAQNSSKRVGDMPAAYAQIFPHITYDYKRDEYVNIKLELLHHDASLLSHLKLRTDDLHDAYSEESDRVRITTLTRAHVSDDFFQFNEVAYRHVYAVTGAFNTASHRTQLASYSHMAETTGKI